MKGYNPDNPAAKLIASNVASSNYLYAINHNNTLQADQNYTEVTNKAISMLGEMQPIMNSIINANFHVRSELAIMGNSICKRIGKHYLYEAEHNNCAYQEIRDEWRAKGNHYLASNIYDIMKENGILPSWGTPYLTPSPPEENQEMIAQLRAQLEELLRLGEEQRDDTILELNNTIEQQANDLITKNNIIVERDNTIEQQANDLIIKNNIIGERDTTIEQQANDLITKNNIIGERDTTILELQTENHNLTGRLTTSEEKYVLSEAKVIPLEKEVADLKHYNEILEADKKGLQEDKIELRDFNKMLVDDKKMLQDEKKLLLVDKKFFQDLNVVKENELAELKHIHFDTEHCTIVGHCNNPDHEGV